MILQSASACTPDLSFLGDWIGAIIGFVLAIEGWLDKTVSYEALIAIPALFVALLVPIAFFLMERQDLYGFDKNVILDKIILAKWSIPLVFLSSTILLLNISIFSMAVCFLLLAVILIVLLRVYKWMVSIEVLKFKNTYKQDMRLKYIRSIKSDVEKVDTWSIILNDENLLEKNQRGLIAEYIYAVKSLRDSKNSYPKSNLLGLMSRNVNKIDFADLQSYEDLVAYAIEYFPERRTVRANNKKAKDKNHKLDYPPYQKRELAISLLKIALDKKASDIFDHIYFTTIQKYLTKDFVEEADFIREFLPAYIHVIKENEDYNARGLWQELSDWIVSEELLTKKASWDKTSALLNAYMESIGQMARLGVNLSDHEARVIDEITECLLPGINVSFWFDIITFYNSGYGLNKGEDSTHAQIRNHVSTRRSFGLFSGVSTDFWIGDEQKRFKAYEADFQRQDEETIYILGLLFRWLYNPQETQKVLTQIALIEQEQLFTPDSREGRRLESLKIRFEKIRSHTARIVANQKGKKQSKNKG